MFEIFGPCVTVATTIAPQGDLANQSAAVNSWLAAGFNVISVNSSAEIEVLQPHFSGVEFRTATTDGRYKFGKPYMYLDNLFTAIKECDSQVCGVINSDIHLMRKDMKEVVYHEAQKYFLFGARLDVNFLGSLETGTWYRGFDYFFFHRELLNLYPPEEFCLGLPWWDYWIVLMPLATGVPVKRIVSRSVQHVIHATNYGLVPWIYLGRVLSKYFPPTFPLTPKSMGLYNAIMFYLIDENPHILQLAE